MDIMQIESNNRKPMPLSVLLAIAFAITLMVSVFSLAWGCAEENVSYGGSCDCSEAANLVCHIPAGSFDDMLTIRISEADFDTHMEHGDTLGACAGDAETEDSQLFEKPCTCSNGDTGHLAYSEDYGDDIYASAAFTPLQ